MLAELFTLLESRYPGWPGIPTGALMLVQWSWPDYARVAGWALPGHEAPLLQKLRNSDPTEFCLMIRP